MNKINIFLILLFFSNILPANAQQYKRQTNQIDAITVERYSRITSGLIPEELKIIAQFIKSTKINPNKKARIAIVCGESIVDIVRHDYPNRSIEYDYLSSIKGKRRRTYCFYEANKSKKA